MTQDKFIALARKGEGTQIEYKTCTEEISESLYESVCSFLNHLVISEPIVSEPGSVTANTHYIIDGVPTEIEARNLAAYMRTRFFRFMVNLLRSNQNMRVDMYQFAPRLDFTRSWKDSDLYDRYELSPEEREFINLVVRNMDSK